MSSAGPRSCAGRSTATEHEPAAAAGTDPREQLVAALRERAVQVTVGAYPRGAAARTDLARAWAWAIEQAGAALGDQDGLAYCISADGAVLTGGDVSTAGSAGPWHVGVDCGDPHERMQVISVGTGAVATASRPARSNPVAAQDRVRPGCAPEATTRALTLRSSTTVVGPSLVWAGVWAAALLYGPPSLERRMAAPTGDYRVIAPVAPAHRARRVHGRRVALA